MKALIDADILLWEIGYGSETGWSAIVQDRMALPNFEYVNQLLDERVNKIMEDTKADDMEFFFSLGYSFRYDIAKTKPYKGHRKLEKPWHYDNLYAYILSNYKCRLLHNMEADDILAIELTKDPKNNIICSRDKDLKQVPGWHYSWELGRQPQFGPEYVSNPGYLKYENGKLTGIGYAFFAAQMLMGDVADNIPGIERVGPKRAYDLLKDIKELSEYEKIIIDTYNDEQYLLEQGQLLWICRRLIDNEPELWKQGLYE